jgi:hypothetical protein
MEVCPECGSEQMATVTLEGRQVLECGLCGSLGGDLDNVEHVLTIRQARDVGVDPQVWPLVRALGRLPGIHVLYSHGGDAGARTLPLVQMQLHGPQAEKQLENIAKLLVLSAAAHRLHWVVEVEYLHGLVFTLKPRLDPQKAAGEAVALARQDLQRLRRDLERDMHLSWWQHP